MTEFPRYGEADLGGAYYFAKEMAGGMTASIYESAVFVHIDGLGHVERVAEGGPGWTAEEIAKLPTLSEARGQHLGPAFAEAQANAKKWQQAQEKAGPDVQPPAKVDPATSRFLYDGD